MFYFCLEELLKRIHSYKKKLMCNTAKLLCFLFIRILLILQKQIKLKYLGLNYRRLYVFVISETLNLNGNKKNKTATIKLI